VLVKSASDYDRFKLRRLIPKSLHGGYYYLDRASGALTFLNASSTGGYAVHHTCRAD
jgi:hypothetical protein